MQNNKIFSNWVEFDLSAIADNVRVIRRICGVPVMAVVKANGYGHGAIPVAHAAIQGGAAWFGVARIEEALELRRGGIESPILVLGYTSPGTYAEAVTQRISMSVWTKDQVKEISIAALQAGLPAHVHLKVDTGMSRLGISPDETYQLVKVVQDIDGVILERYFYRIVFTSDRDKGVYNLYWTNADGTGDVTWLTDTPDTPKAPWSWHPSGKFLAFFGVGGATQTDVMILPMEGDAALGWTPGKPTVFLGTPASENFPVFSPDGRWIAYASAEPGGPSDIYVRPFPGPGDPWRISTAGGRYPRWSAMASELLIIGQQATIMAARYAVVGDSFRAPGSWSPPWDTAALVTAIERLLGSSELRKQMGAAGSKRVNEKFRIERTVDQISALYAGLLG